MLHLLVALGERERAGDRETRGVDGVRYPEGFHGRDHGGLDVAGVYYLVQVTNYAGDTCVFSPWRLVGQRLHGMILETEKARANAKNKHRVERAWTMSHGCRRSLLINVHVT